MSLQISKNLLLSIIALWATFLQVNTAPLDASSPIEFIILHNNDMHARFEQTGILGNKCTPQDAASNKCYGGFARLAHEVRKFREDAKKPNGTSVLYLNAGDTYTGTPWFYVYKDNITAEFLNVIKPDAISLGNHEFDEGITGLVPFLNEVNFPVLAANIDYNKTPGLQNTKSLQASHVFTVNGMKVGIIGYLTPETKTLSNAEDVEFTPEVKAINEEAQRLKQEGVNIIIALGHSGYRVDLEIAKNCPEVDVVIGGHSNTFLYNGQQPNVEKIDGPYPNVVRQASGKEVPVVQAYAYTKYLGSLKLKFDAQGNLLHWDGAPILLNAEIPQDSDLLTLLDLYRPKLLANENDIVGKTKVFLDGEETSCRMKECNLGNLITDSMVKARSDEYMEEGDEFWTDAAIAFLQGGGIRASISKKEDGSITREELVEVLPYNNTLYMVEMTGAMIRNALELSASRIGLRHGGFLQMSGVHVIYDAKAPVNKRVVSAKVLCAKCAVPRYYELEDTEKYNVITTSFLLGGGDGFTFVNPDVPSNGAKLLKLDDIEAAVSYIKANSPVYPGIGWRINIEGYVPGPPGTTTTTTEKPDGASSIIASGLMVFVAMLLQYLR